jgi:hypothetical protein
MGLYLGVDPGITGALSIVDCAPGRTPALVSCIDVPVAGEGAKKRVAVGKLSEWLDKHDANIKVAYIERAQAMPDQGSSSGFLYGRCVGALEATVLLHGIPLRTAEPSVWKRAMGLSKQGKPASLANARLLVTGSSEALTRAGDHNRAESMLIAVWGATQQGVLVPISFQATRQAG